MKLSEASTLSLLVSTTIEGLPICEDGEGPRWKFNYSNWHNDPKPDILLLGAYTHPNTGNNLVGGINLNYLNKRQRDELAKVLPRIMQAGNLYSRYHTGRQLAPDIFNNFYRTYNARHIRGVETGVFYPKYGFMKTAKDFVKKAVGGLFKSRAQRAKEAEPQYPSDLEGMSDTLDNVVTQLSQQQPQPQQQHTPEIKAAHAATQQHKMDRAYSMMDIDQVEAEPFIKANQELQHKQLQQGNALPHAVQPEVRQQADNSQSYDIPMHKLGQSFEHDRIDNAEELTDPDNDIDIDDHGIEEEIRYYSQTEKRLIIESIRI